MRRVILLGIALLPAGGCRRSGVPAPAQVQAPADAPRSAMRATSDKAPTPPVRAPEPRPLERCFPGDAPEANRPLESLLDRYADLFDRDDYAAALVCAEEAARVEPRSVEAHHDRAAAYQALGRLDDAQAAFARALALDPDDPETLAGAADLYINHLAPSNDHSETGLEYARRGSRRIKHGRDRGLAVRLALLEGQALNDLGRAREAVGRLDAAIAAAPEDQRVRYERGVSLFELCRFDEAKRAFVEVLDKTPDDAWAHHHYGLVLERLGDTAGAERELARARQLAPSDFPAPVIVDEKAFRGLVDAEVAKLPPELRGDLGRVHLETADLPDVADLTAEEPPLSPTILGLFRGAPLGEPEATPGDGDPVSARTIVLYRKNLGRAVTSQKELVAQIRTTLYHELGHLRGEDDEELRARGLE